MELDFNSREQSEFNDAFGYLGRLNIIFYAADNSAIELQAHTWFHCLLALYRELSTHMKPEEITEKNSEISKINDDIGSYLKKLEKNPQVGIPSDLYMKLHNFELFLRRIYNESGLEGRKMDDAGRALK